MWWILGSLAVGGYTGWMAGGTGEQAALTVTVFGLFGLWFDRELEALVASNPSVRTEKLIYAPSAFTPPSGGKGTTQLGLAKLPALPKAA